VFFYQVAMRTGIDAIGAMATQLGLGTVLETDLPNVATGLVPTHEWAKSRNIHWVEGDTVVQGIGQGYTALTPLSMATAVARIASGRAVSPYITRRINGEPQPGMVPADLELLDIDPAHLAVVRQGMFEVVNTPAGTAYTARLTLPGVQMAGKTGTAQVHDNTAAERVRNFNDNSMAWAQRPNALFIAFAPVDNPRYAAAVVVEHGLWGGTAAAPIARDLLTYALTKDPAGRDTPVGTQISDAAVPS
jgi:penicillin-binding protein 2